MSQAAKALVLSGEDRGTLESWVNAHSTPQQIALRAQLILCAADGVANIASLPMNWVLHDRRCCNGANVSRVRASMR